MLADVMSDASKIGLERARHALREGRWSDARRELLAALDGLRAHGGEPLADALRSLGEVARKLSEGEAAQARYEEAVAILRDCDRPLKLAHVVRHLGDVHRHNGHPELARPCYDEALSLYRAYPAAERLDLANAIRSMAVLRQEAGDREPARALWTEARELYAAQGIDAGVAECDRRLRQLANAARE